MSFGQDLISPGTYTLVFSGSTIIQSSFVQSFRSHFKRLTEIQQRQNFWTTTTLLDGRYPAQVWEHSFQLYVEATTPTLFADAYMSLETQISSDPLALQLKESAATRVDFGNVYLDQAALEQPRDLLLYRAGFLRVSFLGTTKPTVS